MEKLILVSSGESRSGVRGLEPARTKAKQGSEISESIMVTEWNSKGTFGVISNVNLKMIMGTLYIFSQKSLGFKC